MAEAVAGFFFEFACGEALKFVKTIFSCDSVCKELKATLENLKLTVDEICKSSESSSQSWLQSIQEFQGKLGDGLQLVEECLTTNNLNLWKKFRNAKRIQKLENQIRSFIQFQMLPNIQLTLNKLPDYCSQLARRCDDMRQPDYSSQLARFAEDLRHLVSKVEEISLLCRRIRDDAEQQNCSFSVPTMPCYVIGFDELLAELKNLALDAHVNVIGITGMAGGGKTTLALALCHDHDVKEYFGNRVIYIRVSKDPSLHEIFGTMWEKLLLGPKPHFGNVEDACEKLQEKIKARNNQQTLVVLDDIWSRSKLEKLLFEGEGYKTIVTTRDEDIIPRENGTQLLRVPCLQEEHALSLFCRWAFGQPTIPSTHDEELVKQVQAECKGLPLALKVIGSSLREKPSPVWESAKKKLARGETISDYHKEDLLERLKTSVDVLDDHEKQCFMDLGAFPEGRKISANALLDIWMYVRGMDRADAFVVLLKFTARNLLELKSDPRSLTNSYGCTYELSFSQHDVMRDLALYMAKEDKMRLYMPQKQSNRDAQIVSFHTGTMDDKQSLAMEFPEAEALVLSFTASEYCIPPFLHTMQKLKVLIIHNYSSQRAKLNGLDAFLPLSQLKTLQLEKLMVHSLFKYCRTLISLEKLSLSLCEGLGKTDGLDRDECFKFPKILEINLDHCSDLEVLPMGICNLNSLEKLSVTNCHLLQKLPDDLGEFSLLQVLRLCACLRLTTLPTSICKLKKLQFLDISYCGDLKELPSEFGELSSLKKLDMREFPKLERIPQTLTKLACHVVCCKNNERQLKSIRKASSKSELTVEVVEEPFSLDWLNS